MDRLAAAGVHYRPPPALSDALAGRITSGNVNPARLAESHAAACAEAPGAGAVLFSNEMLFRSLVQDSAGLQRLVARGVAVTVLLFVRDPVELAVSSYVQNVKRGGEARDLDTVLAEFRFLDHLGRFLNLCRRLGLTLRTANYSRVRGRLLAETETLLGLAPDTLRPPPVAQVNRSLTRAELAVMRALNGALDRAAASAVADALCNDLPDIPAEAPWASPEAFAAFRDRIAPQVARLSARLPPRAALRLAGHAETFGAADPAQGGTVQLRPAQVDAVARGLARWTAAERAR